MFNFRLRNFLLCLSLLVVVCYAKRVVMRTTPADDVAHVYTIWRYGTKQADGTWLRKKEFYVTFEDVPNPEEFINEFTAKGKQIVESYKEIVDGKRTKNILEFEKATDNPTDQEEVFGTIGQSISDDIQINIPDYNSVSGVVDTTPFLKHIGAKSKPLLKGKSIQSKKK
eukprot:Platyproteum_vivax@DN7443_c0_g2_i17.p1